MSTAIVVLWWLTLGVAVVLVGPIAFYLLNRTFKATRTVSAYTAETLEAARGVAANLAGAEALDNTAELSARARNTASGLAADARELESALRE